MPRFATIDVGSHSILIYIAERGKKGTWRTLVDRAYITRLGEGLRESGYLRKEAMERTVQRLCEFVDLAEKYHVEEVIVVGTMALRTSKNSKEFIDLVKRRCNLTIKLISGEEEAQLSYLGIKSDLKISGERIIIIDVGGGSTELILGRSDKIVRMFSLNMGSIGLTEKFLKSDPVKKDELSEAISAIEERLAKLKFDFSPDFLVGAGGTITSLAAIKHKLEDYDSEVVNASELTLLEIEEIMEMLRATSLSKRKEIPGLEAERSQTILAGTAIVYTITRKIGMDKLIVSDKGIRHGLMRKYFGR